MTSTYLDHAVYPRQARPLQQRIAQHLDAATPSSIEGEIFALVAPHTNLVSGGRAAAPVYKLLEDRSYDTVVLIAAGGTSPSQRINICTTEVYQTPLGALVVNDKMRHELCDEDDDIYLDDRGHFTGEGIDVQLPYLQTMLKTCTVVPVVMGEESPELCRELGHAIGEVTYNNRVLMVASAEVKAASAEHLAEFKACFEATDVSRLMILLNSERVHMTGKGPLLATMIAAQYRRTCQARVLCLEAPQEDTPGYVGAVLWY